MTAALLLIACGGAPAPQAPAPALPRAPDGAPDVIVFSLDTTREDLADAATMPALDALAKGGTRFSWAFSHAPTTASSHASVFTGRDPHGHGVVRNGHALNREIPTLAERFSESGWDTAGIVAASVLDRSTGLQRGFGSWLLELPVARTRRHEARADSVADRARERLGAQAADRPLFLFVHFYDAHGPYDAPAPFTRRFGDPAYAGPVDGAPAGTTALAQALRAGKARVEDISELRARYRGELAFVDSQLARVLEARRARPTLVAVFGDHGEALGDGGELLQPIGHGADVDLVATHVPLVIAGPGVPVAGVVERTVAISSLGSTLLARAGVQGELGDGKDLLGEEASRAVPLEATQPVDAASATGWPNLPLERGIVDDRHLLVTTPWRSAPPRLHARAPGQPAAEDSQALKRLHGELQRWDSTAPGSASAEDPAQKEALRALGYAE